MAFRRVASEFMGQPSVVAYPVQVSPGRTKQVVSAFANLAPDAAGHQGLGRRSLSLIDGAISWDGEDWENLGGDFRSNPATARDPKVGAPITTTDPAYRVFIRGMDNALWVKWSNGTSWFGPNRVGGDFRSELSVVSTPRGLHVLVRGSDEGPARGQLWTFYYGPSSRDIDQMDIAPLGGTFEGNPRAITDQDGHTHVFVRGLDNRLWRNWFDGRAWRGFESLGGPNFAGDPVPVLVRQASGGPTPGGLFVFVRTMDGTGLVYRRVERRDSPWSPLVAGELSRTVGSEPSGVSRGVGIIDLFVRGDSAPPPGGGFLWHTGQTLSPVAEAPFNDWEDLSFGPFPAAPCAVAAGGTIHQFVRGWDNALWHTWWDGRAWQ
jgi:hypothetical protein